MNIDSGVFLGSREQLAVFRNVDLWIMEPGRTSAVPIETQREARFLSACPHGVYLAFWSFSGESFRLVDIAGNEIWSSWMNSDKCVPDGVHFSTSGDAAACFYHFEPLPGIFFCDINAGFSTTFGCSGSPIGFDADLRYFAINGCDPFEDEKLAYYERGPGSGTPAKVPPEAVSRMLKERPLLLDRNRCIISNPVVPMRDWQGLAIQPRLAGFVILKDCNLYWFNRDSLEPETTIPQCLPEGDRYGSFHTRLHLSGDNVLICQGDHAVAVNRRNGVIFKGADFSSIDLKDKRVLAVFKDGSVAVARQDGSIEQKIPPLRGFKTLGANINENILSIACLGEMSGNIIFKTYQLEQLNQVTR
jgi:hypothetical protein